MANGESSAWPPLPYGPWRETRSTLHLWTQIVGKIRLQQTPWLNHSWHVPLYVTAKGLTTSPVPYGWRSFEMQFDFNEHELLIDVSDGGRGRVPLRPQTVADFHAALMRQLGELDIPVTINELPCEIAEAVHRFWLALIQCDRVMKQFRTGFLGKVSPVHFFWGSFDLAVTRFSGRTAPPFSGKVPGVATAVMREAYSHEVSSAGFWPGGNGIDYPAFYSYAYPVPPDFHSRAVRPEAAFFGDALGEFLLPYEAVRTAADPDAALMEFLQSTYEAAAESAHWDRASLERPTGVAGVCPA
jgi:hypothetical protein